MLFESLHLMYFMYIKILQPITTKTLSVIRNMPTNVINRDSQEMGLYEVDKLAELMTLIIQISPWIPSPLYPG